MLAHSGFARAGVIVATATLSFGLVAPTSGATAVDRPASVTVKKVDDQRAKKCKPGKFKHCKRIRGALVQMTTETRSEGAGPMSLWMWHWKGSIRDTSKDGNSARLQFKMHRLGGSWTKATTLVEVGGRGLSKNFRGNVIPTKDGQPLPGPFDVKWRLCGTKCSGWHGPFHIGPPYLP